MPPVLEVEPPWLLVAGDSLLPHAPKTPHNPTTLNRNPSFDFNTPQANPDKPQNPATLHHPVTNP
jgi:hypothetical protein